MLLEIFLNHLKSLKVRDVNTWIPGSRVAYPGPDPGPVKLAICPVTMIAFIKALTARVATYRRVLHWLQQKARSGQCVNSLFIIIPYAAR